jgi:hypothetical protein
LTNFVADADWVSFASNEAGERVLAALLVAVEGIDDGDNENDDNHNDGVVVGGVDLLVGVEMLEKAVLFAVIDNHLFADIDPRPVYFVLL